MAWPPGYVSVISEAAEAKSVLFAVLFPELHTRTGRQSINIYLNEPKNEYITPPQKEICDKK